MKKMEGLWKVMTGWWIQERGQLEQLPQQQNEQYQQQQQQQQRGPRQKHQLQQRQQSVHQDQQHPELEHPKPWCRQRQRRLKKKAGKSCRWC